MCCLVRLRGSLAREFSSQALGNKRFGVNTALQNSNSTTELGIT